MDNHQKFNVRYSQKKEKELKTFRTLLLITFFAYPLFGYINTFIQQIEDIHNFIERCLFSLLIIIFVSISYKSTLIRDNFYSVIKAFTYLGFSHLTYIGATKGFSFSHSLGMILVLTGTSFVYRKTSHLKFYLIYNALIISISALIAPSNHLDSITVIILFYTSLFVIYFALQLKEKNQQNIENKDANIDALLENAEGIIWSIDTDLNFIAFNKSFLEFIKKNASSEIIKGKSCIDLFKNIDLNAQFSEHYFQVFKGKTSKFECEIENETFIFNLHPIKVNEYKIVGVTVIGNNISIQKNYELKLIKAKDLAENLAHTKEHFLASMSHEIRTPLNGILGFTKLLLQDPNLSTAQLQQLTAIKNSGDILLVIINDILDISKIEAGKMNLEKREIDIYSITKQAIDTFEVKTIEKKLKIQLKSLNTIPSLVLGDPVRVSQIILNIISNSVKFTPDHGEINIHLSSTNHTNNKALITIEIEDTGIGISKENLSIIFDPFIQTSNDTARKYGGTGLGLSIVKKIVDLMEGSIEVISEENKGTKFTISIPFNTVIDTEQKTNMSIEKNLYTSDYSSFKILLAEDNLINQLLAQTVLKQFGFQVTTVENGKLAIDAIEKEHFDLILMDLMMPEINGYDATIEIRKQKTNPNHNIPIIALTADVTLNDIEKCKNIGLNDYISKPFDSQELLKKIESLLKKT